MSTHEHNRCLGAVSTSTDPPATLTTLPSPISVAVRDKDRGRAIEYTTRTKNAADRKYHTATIHLGLSADRSQPSVNNQFLEGSVAGLLSDA